MRKIAVVKNILLYTTAIILLVAAFGLSACYTKYEPTFEDIPVSFQSGWRIDDNAFLDIKITNNSKKKIVDIFVGYSYEMSSNDFYHGGGLSSISSLFSKYTGKSILSLQTKSYALPISMPAISAGIDQIELDLFITWIKFSDGTQWGNKGLVSTDKNLLPPQTVGLCQTSRTNYPTKTNLASSARSDVCSFLKKKAFSFS